MSFILDALQKSETDRRRAASPALAGMAIEQPRVAIPVWTWMLIGLLLIAVLGLGVAWWNSARLTGRSAMDPLASDLSVAGAIAPGTNAPNTAVPLPAPDIESGSTVAPNDAADASTVDDSAAAGPRGAATSDDREDSPISAVPAAGASFAGGAAPAAQPRPEEEPADLLAAPAVPAPDITLPTIEELIAAGVDVPELTLELHVYHPSPASRWVYINGGRYTEGQVTAAGPRIIEIRPEGVTLSFAGRDFLLLAQ